MPIKVRQGGAWIDVTGGSDTTYTLPLTGANGGASVGSAKWTLDASTGTDTSVTLNPGTNISISSIDVTGDDRSFTLDATNSKYDYVLVDHGSSTGAGTGNDSILRLDGDTASGNTDDDIRLIAGTNVIFTPNTSANTLTIAATPGGVTTFIGLTDTPASYSGQDGKLVKVNSGPNGLEFADETTYLLKCTKDADGGSTGTDGDPYLFLDASSGTDDSIQISGANGVSVTRNSDSQLTIDGSLVTGTTYTLPVFGSGNGSSGLRLTGSDSSTDDVNVTGSGGITVIGSGTDTLTVDGSSVTGTTYDLITSTSGSNIVLTLDASAGDDDPITITAGSNITLTEDGSGTGFTIASSGGGGANTTYDLGTRSTPSIRLTGSDGSTDDITFSGTNGITVTSGGDSQSSGTITIDGSSVTGTKYDYVLVDHGSSTGAGSGNDSILRLDGATASGNADDDIRLIAGSNVTFTPNTSANTLTIAASGGGGGSGPTYTLPLTGSGASATWTLTPSTGSGANAVKLNAGNNVSFSSFDTTGPDYEFTIDVTAAGGLSLDTTVTDVLDLTGSTLSADDAGADRIIFWDESAGKLTHLTAGTGLQISGTTLTATGGGSSDEHVTSASFNTGNGVLTLNRNVGGAVTVDLDGRYAEGTDDYVNSASFNTGNGILTLGRVEGGSVTVDLDGRYAEGSNTTYDLAAANGGDTNSEKINLTGSDGSTDTVTLAVDPASTLTIARSSNTITFGGGGAGGITVQDEGTPLSTLATILNFVGSNVTATGTGATKTITVTGGSVSSLNSKITTYTSGNGSHTTQSWCKTVIAALVGAGGGGGNAHAFYDDDDPATTGYGGGGGSGGVSFYTGSFTSDQTFGYSVGTGGQAQISANCDDSIANGDAGTNTGLSIGGSNVAVAGGGGGGQGVGASGNGSGGAAGSGDLPGMAGGSGIYGHVRSVTPFWGKFGLGGRGGDGTGLTDGDDGFCASDPGDGENGAIIILELG